MQHSFESHIGEDSAVTVEFEYTDAVDAILHGDNSQPGEPALVEDLAVYIVQDDITECLSQHVLDRLEQEAHEEMAEIPEFMGTRAALGRLSVVG